MVLLIDITIAVRAPYLRPNHAIHALKSGTKVQYISDFHTTIMQLFDFLGSFCYHGIANLQIDIPQFTNVNGQKEEYFEGRKCKRMERRCIDNEISAAKVIQVRFITPVDGQTEFYFGSVAAIYTVFTRDDLGIKESTLRNSKFPKRTNRCVISKFTSCGTSLPIMGRGGRWLDRMLLLGGSYVHITFTQSAYVWLT